MSENEQEQPPASHEAPHDDPVVRGQQGKGYGEDEGEREDSLEDD